MNRICVFGDSITWGRGLSYRVSWANLLRNYLEAHDTTIHLYDLGIDGNTTADLLQRVSTEAAARKPDTIIWAIGTNDSACRADASDPIVSEVDFQSNMLELINLGKALEATQIIVGIAKGSDAGTVPLPESKTRKCYTKDRVKNYDCILQEISRANNITHISISGILSDDDFYDGLHPSEVGHMKMFLEIQPTVLQLLGRKSY